MKKLSFAIIFCCCCFVAIGQRKKVTLPPFTPHFSLNVLPSALIEPDPSTSVQLLYRPKQRLGIAVEGGFIFKSTFNHAVGFRFRPEVRLYRPFGKRSHNFYLAVQALYKRQEVNTLYEQWQQQGTQWYSTLHAAKIVKHAFGAAILIGINKPLDRKQRFWIDTYIGLGPRYKIYVADGKTIDINTSGSDNYDRYFSTIEINTLGPSATLLAGARLGIRLN